MAKLVESVLLLKIINAGAKPIESTGSLLATTGKLMTASFAMLSAVIGAALMKYRASELALNSLNQAMISQGVYTKALSQSYLELSEQLSGSTEFSKDEITQAQARIQMYIGHHTVSKEVIKATLDLASGTGMALESAAQAVGKSIGTSVNALARSGIILDENISQSQKTAQIIQQIESRFGGQSEAATQGLGSIKKMNQAVVELLSVLGKVLAPVIIALADQLKAFTESLQDNDNAINLFVEVSIRMGQVATLFKASLKIISGNLTTAFNGVFQSASLLLDAKFEESYDRLAKANDVLIANFLKEKQSTIEELSAWREVRKNADAQASEAQLKVLSNSAQERIRQTQEELSARDTMFTARSERDINREILFEKLKSDKHLSNLNYKIQQEQDNTKRLALELEKKKYLNEQIYDMETRRAIALNKLVVTSSNSQMDQLQRILASYQQFQKSKYTEMIQIGKAAAIAAMVVSGSKAVAVTYEWVSMIPVAGEWLAPAMAGLVGAWYLEQINNIAASSLENPGRISMGLSFDGILNGIKEAIRYAPQHMLNSYANKYLDVAAQMADVRYTPPPPEPGVEQQQPAQNYFSIGMAFKGLAALAKVAADVAIGIFESLIDFAGSIINVIGDVIGDIFDFFGFAEGGLVTSDAISTRVTALDDLGMNYGMGSDINIKITGGLTGSEAEAKNLALLIHTELTSRGGRF